ncbi:TetR/AcrR family transcriptional regulator [Litoreibacter arenae]|uniref:Transcriptional regulator, TetR family n=1 Tax=Litoreibacter arenae DSM 19593 TaxID=1123360 RepID=S9RUW8_9RHOB|nr:TetR/AcrR family transcriptional regulator [Litoreibacter arenae]EPX77739.1 Transcriptional regulator, TetR family [Litoreibacter arenae DSM 19593]
MNTNVRQKNLPAEERRNVTVEAVVELAAHTNPSDITTAAIAKHMNLTQGALFRHFPNKDAIWQAVMKWVAERLLARIDKAAEGVTSPLETMQAMFHAHVAFVAEHPGAPRMLFGELQGAKATPAKLLARELMKQYAARLSRLIEAGKACGELPDELETKSATTLFIGMIQGLVMQSLIAGDMEQMRVNAPHVFAIYRRGIETAQPANRGGEGVS